MYDFLDGSIAPFRPPADDFRSALNRQGASTTVPSNSRGCSKARRRLGSVRRAKPGFLRKRKNLLQDQPDLPCPVPPSKRFPFAVTPNHFYIRRRPVPHEGRSRSSRTWSGMRWTLTAPLTNGARGGRRSRVVLTPRRWRQVSRKLPRSDGGKRARSPGRARRASPHAMLGCFHHRVPCGPSCFPQILDLDDQDY